MRRSLLLLLALAQGACTWDWDAFRDPLVPMGEHTGTFELTFQEECEAPLDAQRWRLLYVGPAPGNVPFHKYDWGGEWADEKNVSVEGGLCRLKLENRPQGGAMYSVGTMNSQPGLVQRLGYFEIRARVPRGVGITSRMTLADPWPPEVEVMSVNGGRVNRYAATYVYRPSASAPAEYVSVGADTVDLSADFHVFGLDWREDRLVYYLDGVKMGERTEGVEMLKSAMRIEIKSHIATEGGTKPDATTVFPVFYDIDWVRVWTRS